jgi:hypothetical protein
MTTLGAPPRDVSYPLKAVATGVVPTHLLRRAAGADGYLLELLVLSPGIGREVFFARGAGYRAALVLSA